jgi:hypothetical protein
MYGRVGKCWAKNDSELTCGDAKTPGQCTWDEVDSFGTNCVWLEGNATGSPEFQPRCTERVCVERFVMLCGVGCVILDMDV